ELAKAGSFNIGPPLPLDPVLWVSRSRGSRTNCPGASARYFSPLPLALIEPGNQPRRAAAVGIILAAELRAQQRLFCAYAREERRDSERREQDADARTKSEGPPQRVDEEAPTTGVV